MTFTRNSAKQMFGEQNYLSHQITGNVEPEPFYAVGDRVSSYGIFNFGQIAADSEKRISLASVGINQPISLSSIYAFTSNASSDEVRFYLFSGDAELVELRLFSAEMPYTFPPGAIIDPSLDIVVRPRSNLTSLLIYWKPVHIITEIQV